MREISLKKVRNLQFYPLYNPNDVCNLFLQIKLETNVKYFLQLLWNSKGINDCILKLSWGQGKSKSDITKLTKPIFLKDCSLLHCLLHFHI